MISIKKKREAVAAIFGVADPEDDYVNFLYQRRHLETVAGTAGRELQYVAELDDLEHALITTLDRMRERDGEKIFRESACYLRQAIDIAMSERRPRGNGAAIHV
jgi:hypothetical protein